MSNEALLHYIRSLGFDTDPWAGDEQRLLIGRFVADSPQLARYGPLVKIEPESGSQHLSYPELQRGRIVARFVNRDTIPYPKLALVARGVTYWWIEGSYQQDSGRGGRAVLITTDSAGRIVRRAPASLYYEDHGEYAYGTRFRRNPRALVRWAWLDNDEQGWYPCPRGCCRVGAAAE